METSIEWEDFKERVRDANPIERIVGEYVEIKENGGRLTCSCVLHDEKTPSMHIYPATQSYYCYGCGAGGDVFDFIVRKESLDFIGALNLLAEKARIEPPTWTPQQKVAAEKKRTEQEELSREIEVYHQALLPNSQAYQAIVDRGISAGTITRFKLGWDAAAKRVTIPVFRHGQPIYLIGWSRSKEPKYKFPAGQEKPVTGVEHLRQDNCLVVEGIFDWLSLNQAGFPAACILGSSASERQLKELMRSPSPIIALDGDKPGRTAAEKLAGQLFPSGKIAQLDDKVDFNDLLVQLKAEMFEAKAKKLVREAKSLIDLRIDNLESLSADEKATYAEESILPLFAEITTIKQAAYLDRLKKELKVSVKVLRQAIQEAQKEQEEEAPAVSAAVIECGREFAKTLGINPLEKVVSIVKKCGVVGEDRNIKVTYVALTSRLLSKPVSIVVKGVSSGGKSHTTEKTIELFPEQAYWARTGLSPHALAYSEEDFRHRTLVIFEASGLGEEGDYLLRSLLSEGRLLYETVESTPTGLKARVIEKPGPTNCILTTTRVKLHPENETRLISLSVNDSTNQTKDILRHTAKGVDQPDLSQWQAFQSYLASEPRDVVIPFASELAEAIPPVAVRLRRDFMSLLSLIKAHAIICIAAREQNQDGHIIATVEDYEVVRELVLPAMSQGVQATVKQTVRDTINAATKLLEKKGDTDTITVKEIANHLKLDHSAASRRVTECLAPDYLINEQTKPRQTKRLRLGDPLPEDYDILPSREALEKATGGSGGEDTIAYVHTLDDTPGEDSQNRMQPPKHTPAHGAYGEVKPSERMQDVCNPQNIRQDEENTSSEHEPDERMHVCTDVPGAQPPIKKPETDKWEIEI